MPRRAGGGAAGRLWQDVIELRGAAPLLTFGQGHLAGIAAATEHEYGQGRAFYLGTLPDRATLGGLVRRVCGHAGIELVANLPRGVEAIRRGEYLFLISHVDQPVEVDIGARCLDRLSSAVVGPRAVLAPRDVLVLGPGRRIRAARSLRSQASCHSGDGQPVLEEGGNQTEGRHGEQPA